MNGYSRREAREELDFLLLQYDSLKRNEGYAFIEEDSFEKIIDHFGANDNLSEALCAADIALTIFPLSVSLLVKKADILIVYQKFTYALSVLQRAEIFEKGNPDIPILRVECYMGLQQHENVQATIAQSLEQFETEDKVDFLFDLADLFDEHENFDKVYDCYETILKIDPSNKEALYKICFWADFTKQQERSVQLHSSIIDKVPYNELAWFNLGAAYQILKLYEKAIDAYLYAIAIEEKFEYAYRNCADAYLRLRDYKKAIEMLESVLRLSPPDAHIHSALAHCYCKIKQYAQARGNYKKAVYLQQEDPKLYYKIAVTYVQEKNWSAAIKYAERALEISPNVLDFNLIMGECLQRIGKNKEALRYLTMAVHHKPTRQAGWEALIVCSIKAGAYKDAARQSIAALANVAKPSIFYFYLCGAFFQLGSYKDALLHLETGMRLAPKALHKLTAIYPTLLQNNIAAEIVAKYKRVSKK